MTLEFVQSLVDSRSGFTPQYLTSIPRRTPGTWTLTTNSLLLENLQEAYSETFLEVPNLFVPVGAERDAELYFPQAGRAIPGRVFAVGRKRVVSSNGAQLDLLFDNSTYDNVLEPDPGIRLGVTFYAVNQTASSILEDRTVYVNSSYVRRVRLRRTITVNGRDYQLITVDFIPQVNYSVTLAVNVDELADGISQLVSSAMYARS